MSEVQAMPRSTASTGALLGERAAIYATAFGFVLIAPDELGLGSLLATRDPHHG